MVASLVVIGDVGNCSSVDQGSNPNDLSVSVYGQSTRCPRATETLL